MKIELRTGAQDTAIYKTLVWMRMASPSQFAMHVGLLRLDTSKRKSQCNSYGCIAGHCVVANLGANAIGSTEIRGPETEARDIMGLTHDEMMKLFTPNTADADYTCTNATDPKHITHRRGILALWYFAKKGVVQWNNETLEMFVARNPLPPMKGVAV